MPDEQMPIMPIHFEQSTVRVVRTWPIRTSLSADFLKMPHMYGATVTSDAVRIETFNGGATYTLGETLANGARVAVLVEGSEQATNRKVMLDREGD